MKRLISKFSDKLLSNQQLKTVKGGNYYCTCASGAPINTASASECDALCNYSPCPGCTTGGSTYYPDASGPWGCGSNGYTTTGYGC